MGFNRKELLDRLRMEILVLERGGYRPSPHQPHERPRLLRDSVGCLNFALDQKQEPCSLCVLMEFVPAELRNKPDPCRLIPLNAAGDTITSLEARGRHEEAEAMLLEWLRRTVAHLEAEEPEEE
ncbi:MAG: hypothetical protein LAN71_05925 [Acidobacteriia bacterium]|nr:hypothetical protein [Terriglobia bacterium]